MDFKPIETQDELDGIIKSRLDRNTKTVTDEVTKKFEGYISPDDYTKKTSEFNGKIDTLTASVADLTAKNKAYENSSVKMKIARELGLPYELADRLSGDTEESIRKDAENLSKFVSKKPQSAPLFTSSGDAPKDATQASLLELAEKLKNR